MWRCVIPQAGAANPENSYCSGSARWHHVAGPPQDRAEGCHAINSNVTDAKGLSMFSIIWSIIVGFIVGLIARWIVPGAEHMGFIMTTIVGIVGSVIGGFIGMLFKKPAPGQKFHAAGFLMSIVGAIVLLYLLRFIQH
ncbi:GlsB/YeaQ/YmgE family stress response membrane protein [Dyella sp.]|uniref:GlsB/YeaQ/YmgE family stress response membrane protein n=1 Tax=Dyella sp. TaxID=1869338 RepID=UPI002D7E9A18|nr:GlsB/YeaQ/YmgE family stress response membrane protein [Dyella sp.]